MKSFLILMAVFTSLMAVLLGFVQTGNWEILVLLIVVFTAGNDALSNFEGRKLLYASVAAFLAGLVVLASLLLTSNLVCLWGLLGVELIAWNVARTNDKNLPLSLAVTILGGAIMLWQIWTTANINMLFGFIAVAICLYLMD